jgi:hypothetical protein
VSVPDEGFDDPHRRLIEEMTLRFERALGSVSRDMRENTRVLRELIGEIKEHRREFRAEYEAQRGTLLAILGCLELIDPRDGPAPSG